MLRCDHSSAERSCLSAIPSKIEWALLITYLGKRNDIVQTARASKHVPGILLPVNPAAETVDGRVALRKADYLASGFCPYDVVPMTNARSGDVGISALRA
jgi:hypothetical protein